MLNKSQLFFILLIALNVIIDTGSKVIVQDILIKATNGGLQTALVTITNILFVLPFVLLFTPSAFISSRYAKSKVLKYSSLFLVPATLIITLFYYTMNLYHSMFYGSLVIIFILSFQAAFFSPSKFSYIKEVFGKDKITLGNSYVQGVSIFSMLFSVFIFTFLFEYASKTVPFSQMSGELNLPYALSLGHEMYKIGIILFVLSLIQFSLSLTLKEIVGSHTNVKFDLKKYFGLGYITENTSTIFKNEIIYLSIIGIALFFSVSQTLISVLPSYIAETTLSKNTLLIQGLISLSGIGVIFGSIIAGRLSKNYIEYGSLPIAVFGMALSVYFISTSTTPFFIGSSILLFGIFGGMFIIPLFSLVQYNSDEFSIGKNIAGQNFIENLSVLSFLGLTVLSAYYLNISPTYMIQICGWIIFLGGVYIMYKIPYGLIKFILSFIVGRRYKISAFNIKNIPESGPVLLLGNHISWVDWAILQSTSPRQIRFVMDKVIFEKWYLIRFFKMLNMIPISSRIGKTGLEEVAQALDAGDMVCLFPEGAISRNGHLGEFKKGFEKILEMATVEVHVMPFYIRGMWGDISSRNRGIQAHNDSILKNRNVSIHYGERILSQQTLPETEK